MVEILILGLGFCGLVGMVLVLGANTIVIGMRQEAKRVDSINARANEGGPQICQSLIAKRISVDMDQEMVLLSWGRPSYVDDQETTRNGNKERWIYGQPRHGANYVWFVNGRVSKIKK